jgi:hypothetical protein
VNDRHFEYKVEVIEAESQAVLNTPTENDFWDAFKKNGRSYGNGVYMQKGITLRPIGQLVLTRWQYQSRKLWMTLCT